MKIKKLISVIGIILVLLVVLVLAAYAATYGCHDVTAGKKATVDGSVLTAQSCDGRWNSRIKIVPAADHEPGEMAPVYKNIVHEDYKPLEKLGEIPQVAHTYKYFDIAYPFANEHQVLIGETTLGGASETKASDYAIMAIEQLEVFGLQRAKTARECIQVMGDLAVEYGYFASCYLGECLTVTDPNEAWVFEIFGVGPLWTPESGKPGAVWCAQRVPDDHVTSVPNYSRIGEIDPNDTDNFMVSSNYKDTAIELGLYDPASGEPFMWNWVYGGTLGKSSDRLWRAYNLLAPSGNWKYNEVSHYPFSIKPDKKVSYKDFIAMYQDVLAGTEYDTTEDQAWYVKARRGEHKGEMVKSSLANPQPNRVLQSLLNIHPRGLISGYGCSYYYITQARDWLPNEIGGVLWFGLDNPKTGVYVPIYVGINEVPESWAHVDRDKFDRESSFWAFAAVDDQVTNLWGYLKPKLDEVLVPMQEEMYNNQESIEQEALKLYKNDPESAKKFLTDYTCSLMEKTEQVYWDLFDRFLYETNNNKLRLNY